MRAKQQELIRDLAKLLAKYSARDWEPIVRLLRAGKSKIPELTAAIENLGAAKKKKRARIKTAEKKPRSAPKAKARKTTSKVVRKRKGEPVKKSIKDNKLEEVAIADSQPADGHLEAWARATLAGSSLSQLHELYFKVVGSKQLPPGRDAVIRTLIDFLQRSSPAQRNIFMNLVQRRSFDETENYRRWAETISRFKHTR